MATTRMTSRERMRRMLERRDMDRIPRHDGFWDETIKRWQREGLPGDHSTALQMLGSDISHCCWVWPVPFPGRHEVLQEDEQTEVIVGSMGKAERLWKARSGTPEHLWFGCDSFEKWQQEYKPALLDAAPSYNLAASKVAYADSARDERFCFLSGIESFEAMRQLVGDEIVLAAMAEEPEWVVDMSQTYTDLILLELGAVLGTVGQADAVMVFGDVGYNHGTFFSPAMYRELVWPDHKRLCDWAHAQGMKFVYHTDGDVRAFLDLFVAAGYDCIQPLEAKAGMDVRQLAPLYGDRLSFWGNIDVTVMETNDRERIEAEVRSKLAAGMANHGYGYYSDHSVPPSVSWSSYQWIIELLDRYGNY